LSIASDSPNNGTDSGAFRGVTPGYCGTGWAAWRATPSARGGSRIRCLSSISLTLLSFCLRLRDCNVRQRRSTVDQGRRHKYGTDAHHLCSLRRLSGTHIRAIRNKSIIDLHQMRGSRF